MPRKSEIMQAVRQGLSSIEIFEPSTTTKWTREVKTELCKIGKRFGYRVYARANEVGNVHRDGGEWLYDVTWLEYKCNDDPRRRSVLADAHLVAECEWGDLGEICDDFEKLLLARASVHVMIFDGDHFNPPRDSTSSKEFAGQLAGRVKEFKGSLAEDAWLLAGWQRSDNEKGWSFRYFTIEMNATIQELD